MSVVQNMDTQPKSENKVKFDSPPPYQAQKTLKLNIPEKLFIISIDDIQKVVATSVKDTLRYGLAGGMLAELALAGKIQLQDNRLVVTDPIPTGDALFDDLLLAIAGEKKPRKLSRWIDTIASKQTVRLVAERLAERNVIRIEKKQYLWIIPYEVYPQVDASAKYWVKQQLRSIVLAGGKAEAGDIALLSLLHACRLLRLVFTRDERKFAGRKVEALVAGEVYGQAVADLLAEIEAAAATAAMEAAA